MDLESSREELGRMVEEASVTYSVKELLSRIETRLIQGQAEAKAQYDELSKKVDKLESFRDRILGFAVAISALTGAASAYLVQLVTGN